MCAQSYWPKLFFCKLFRIGNSVNIQIHNLKRLIFKTLVLYDNGLAVFISNPPIISPSSLLKEAYQSLSPFLQEVHIRVGLPEPVLKFAKFV